MKINQKPTISLPVEPAKWRQDGFEDFKKEQASFEAILWHELVGHVILGLGHPNLPENSVNFRSADPYGQRIWFNYIDPTIKIENEARKILKQNQRARWYYGW